MNKRLIILLLISIFFVSCKITKHAKNKENEKFDFPLDWIGEYDGKLIIHPLDKDTIEVNMQLNIGYPDLQGYYPWTIIYNEEDIRQYGLEAIDASKGHYKIDEFNSIKLDAYYSAGHFLSRFEVLSSDLLIDYERVKGGIEVSFFISSQKAINITGDEIIGLDTVPPVKSFQFQAYQKAFLKKKNTDN